MMRLIAFVLALLTPFAAYAQVSVNGIAGQSIGYKTSGIPVTAPKSFSMIGDSRANNLVSSGLLTNITAYQWFNWANAINGHNMILIANYGISGDRSDQFLQANLATVTVSRFDCKKKAQ